MATILDELAQSRVQDLPAIKEAIINIPKNLVISANRKTLYQKIRELKDSIGIISELKPASPSRGNILLSSKSNSGILTPTIPTIKIKAITNSMIDGSVIGISVLTEPRRFGASFGNLREVANVAPKSTPILLKDFIIDESQLQLGHACGASNALLIASICDPVEMALSMKKYNLEPLVEIHDEDDLHKIEPLKKLAEGGLKFVIGINNRNLKDLSIDLSTTHSLFSKIQAIFGREQPIITESGIFTREDMIQMEERGIKAALIGTAIMEHSDIAYKIRSLLGNSDLFVKICGITEKETFPYLEHPDLSAFGFIIEVPKSHRSLSIDQAKLLLNGVKSSKKFVVVSKNKTLEEIKIINKKLKPDYLQIHNIDNLNGFPLEILNKMIIPINTEHGETKSKISALPKEIYAILLDASEGTHKKLNLTIAKKVLTQFPNRKFILAGGIDAINVKKIISTLHPFGIDLSSSLEREKKKDPILINEFMEEITQIKKKKKKKKTRKRK